MKSIGFDEDGDEHMISDGEDESMHTADSLCGCNPDPFCHDPAYWGDYTTPATWWWGHHDFKSETEAT